MRLSTHQGYDRFSVLWRIGIDMSIWIVAFLTGTVIRFFGNTVRFNEALSNYAPGLLISSLGLVAAAYICGLYSAGGLKLRLRRRIILITCCLIAAGVVLLALGSINFSLKVGRGVLLLSVVPASIMVWIHHMLIHKSNFSFKERAVVLVSSEEDETEALLLRSMELRNCLLLGCYVSRKYQLKTDIERLGHLDEIQNSVDEGEIDRVYCTMDSLRQPEVTQLLRRLRYSGVAISATSQACEETYQAIPLDMIDDEWLLHACGQPGHIYIAKVKRLIDITASIAIGLPLLPFLLLGVVLVKMWGGAGPILFRQERLGRFGKKFEVLKLRSMGLNAEASGAQWSTANDPRVTTVGRFLRKFRIDEIPQLWNILRGDMSFVGPRPERQEFIKQLSDEIPYFSERLLILPGLTGWAQVCYPYGATVEDARRKLEFDLYYLKNMGLITDLFVILDTVKIVLTGGASLLRGNKLAEFEDKLKDARQQVTATCSKKVS
ncbi:MAG: exopolysaccharide biosynthesis polyprenyl glycosylphosphotransferase [Luteolibacter sp.]